MFQLNLPKKAVSTVHVLVSLVLIIAALIFSFAPIVSFDVGDDDLIDGINELIVQLELGEDGEYEIPKEIDISAPKLIASIGLIANIISAAVSDETEGEDKAAEIGKLLDTPEGKDSVITCMAIVTSIIDSLGIDISSTEGSSSSESTPDSIISVVFNVLITMVCIFYLLAMTLIIPIMFIIIAIVALFAVLKNLGDLSEAKASVARQLPGKLTIVMTIMLFQCVLSTIHYGSGIKGIWVLALVSVGINFISTRLRSYESEEFKYLNIVQGASIVSIVGFIIFFFNLIDTGIFTSFVNGKWPAFLTKVTIAQAAKTEVATKGYIIDAVLILVYLVVVLASVKFLAKCAQRLSCAIPYGKGGISLLPTAIALLLVYIIPTYISGQNNYYDDVTKTTGKGSASFLELEAAQSEALTMVLVGIIIMIVAELAIVVLKKVFCPHMTTDKVYGVLSGSADTKKKADKAAEEGSAE